MFFMRGISRTVILVSVIVLMSSCMGLFFKKQESSRPAASDATAPQTETPIFMEPALSDIPPAAPSFQDGDHYIQAVSTQSVEPCRKINSENLRARCEKDALGGA